MELPKHFESLYPENSWDQQIGALVSSIREGNSSQLVGIPGVGRASLLGLLAYNKGVRMRHFPQHHNDVHFVMANFSEVRNRPLIDVMKFLFLSLSTSLRERNMLNHYEVVDRYFKESIPYNDELVLIQGLKQVIDYLAVEQKLTLIFLFDRFDEYIPQLTAGFFTNLRSLRDRAKYRFSVVFSVARPLEDVLEQQLFADFSDFFVGHAIYLPLFDEPSVTFRLSYLEKLTGKTLSQSLVEKLIVLTGGHLRLMKLSAEAVLGSGQMDSVDEGYLGEQKTIQSALGGIWNSLTPAEQHYLLTQETDEASELYLQRVGLLSEKKITIPLLTAFVAKKDQRDEEIVFDEQTNTIKKGDVTISDTLTKAEFRLLRFLLQNKERVVERDEIVSVVWQEGKSTAGVTEQAIDQLIFRLRRKIEPNPNNPSHILTVKGRGIKYLP